MTPTTPAEGLTVTAEEIADYRRMDAQRARLSLMRWDLRMIDMEINEWLHRHAPALLALAEKALAPLDEPLPPGAWVYGRRLQ